jgi:hypothetical protein
MGRRSTGDWMHSGSATGGGEHRNNGLQPSLSGGRVAKLHRSATAKGFVYFSVPTAGKCSDSGG